MTDFWVWNRWKFIISIFAVLLFWNAYESLRSLFSSHCMLVLLFVNLPGGASVINAQLRWANARITHGEVLHLNGWHLFVFTGMFVCLTKVSDNGWGALTQVSWFENHGVSVVHFDFFWSFLDTWLASGNFIVVHDFLLGYFYFTTWGAAIWMVRRVWGTLSLLVFHFQSFFFVIWMVFIRNIIQFQIFIRLDLLRSWVGLWAELVVHIVRAFDFPLYFRLRWRFLLRLNILLGHLSYCGLLNLLRWQ